MERIKELEVVYEHDMIAFITNVQEFIEQAGYGNIREEFHKGVTSYDIEDPAMVLLLRRSTLEISGELKKLIETIWQKAEEHKVDINDFARMANTRSRALSGIY